MEKSTPSGFAELHVLSATLASQAPKARESAASVIRSYPEIVRFDIITDQPSDDVWGTLDLPKPARPLDENSVFAKRAWLQQFAPVESLSPKRAFWYYQQVLKLARLFALAAELAEHPDPSRIGLLIWDADTLLTRRIRLWDPRTAKSFSYFTLNAQERHQPFYAINAYLTDTRPDQAQPFSNIVQFAALSVTETIALADFLRIDCRSPHCADEIGERIVAAIRQAGLTNAGLFSEYELIGLFKHLRLHSPTRRARFIRVNRRPASATQLRLMGRAGIVHFTSEEWFGPYSRLGNWRLLAYLIQQHFPRSQRLQALLSRSARGAS